MTEGSQHRFITLQESLRDNPSPLHLPGQCRGVQELQAGHQEEAEHPLPEGAVPALQAPEAPQAAGIRSSYGEHYQQGAETGNPGETVHRVRESLQVRTGESCRYLIIIILNMLVVHRPQPSCGTKQYLAVFYIINSI